MAISVNKPTVGGSEDTWGETINTALDTIVDAVNGTSGTVAPDHSTLTINGDDVTATAAELNKLDGVTASTAEINYVDGVTSNIQTQLDGKVPTSRTVTTGGGLTGGGALSSNQTISHADTSSQSSVNNSGNTVIQDVSLDSYGHVTSLTSKALSIPTVYNATIGVLAGGGMSGGGYVTTNQSFNENITISHSDTSSQGNVNNSGNTVIQDINVDGYGHVTSIGSKTLSIPAAYSDSQARAAQHVSGGYAGAVGQYRLARSFSGGGGSAPNTTQGGGNLGPADVTGNAYKSGGAYVVLGGSWRRMGYQHSDGSLSTGAVSNATTLYVRYA